MINEQPLGQIASKLSNPEMESAHLYGTSEGITNPALDTKKPVGNGIDAPVYQQGVAKNGVVATTADVTDSSTNINQTSSDENLSAKFKNPQATAEYPAAGNSQYQN